MASIFTKIINGDIPCYKVAEDDNYFAFLDIHPVKKGHLLVIPKIEVDYLFDLEDDILGGLHIFAKKVAIALKNAIPCTRVGVLVLGMEVPHAHLHLIPLDTERDILLTNPKLHFSAGEMTAIADGISKEL